MHYRRDEETEVKALCGNRDQFTRECVPLSIFPN